MDETEEQIRLARMTTADVPQVHQIERMSFVNPWDLASYYAEVDNPASIYLVAHRGEEIVGFGGMWVVENEAHIVTLAVDPDYRNQGIGRELMRGLLEEARTRHVEIITLEVRVSNDPAKKLYTAFGFRTIAFRRNYYPDNNEDAEVMSLHLTHTP